MFSTRFNRNISHCSFPCVFYKIIPVHMFDNQILMHEPTQLLFYSQKDGSGYAGSFPQPYAPTLNKYILYRVQNSIEIGCQYVFLTDWAHILCGTSHDPMDNQNFKNYHPTKFDFHEIQEIFFKKSANFFIILQSIQRENVHS